MFFLLLILLIVLSLIDNSYQYQIVRVPLSFFGIRHPLLSRNKSFSSSSWQLLAETSSNNLNNDNNNISKTKNNNPPLNRKKKKIVINTNLIGVDNISSDGNLTEQKKKQKEAQKLRENIGSNLGKTSKKKKNNNDLNRNNSNNKKISKKAQKLVDQRTANGAVDGTLQAGLAIPEEQEIQVQEVKRGNKQVTIVRGFLCPMDERKKVLKDIKQKIGGGGALIDGIIEVQGAHSDVVIKMLTAKGYTKTKKR